MPVKKGEYFEVNDDGGAVDAIYIKFIPFN
jgi:hypothetical protein